MQKIIHFFRDWLVSFLCALGLFIVLNGLSLFVIGMPLRYLILGETLSESFEKMFYYFFGKDLLFFVYVFALSFLVYPPITKEMSKFILQFVSKHLPRKEHACLPDTS